jgi:hypothetical protein
MQKMYRLRRLERGRVEDLMKMLLDMLLEIQVVDCGVRLETILRLEDFLLALLQQLQRALALANGHLELHLHGDAGSPATRRKWKSAMHGATHQFQRIGFAENGVVNEMGANPSTGAALAPMAATCC